MSESGPFLTSHHWIIEVINDLRLHARSNNFNLLSDSLDAAMVAALFDVNVRDEKIPEPHQQPIDQDQIRDNMIVRLPLTQRKTITL